MSVTSPKLRPVVLVKSFLNAKEGEEGVRVLSWILERWEGVAVGLLDVGTVRDLDIGTWEAGFLSTHSRKSSSATESEGCTDSETAYSDSSREGQQGQEYKGYPFPESVLVEQVPVREVRDCIVIMEDVHVSTRGSSPTTLWSQETGSNKEPMSRIGSLQASILVKDGDFVAELRKRMDAQEAELTALRRELHTIRERFAFPFPPDSTPSKIDDEDEDMMPTPRPPSRPHCVDIESRSDCEAPKPLFQHTIGNTLEEGEDRILHPGVFSDLGPSSPGGSPPSLFMVNPDLVKDGYSTDVDSYRAREAVKGRGALDELFTARDALRSALAAMEPVKVQLRLVEKELETRGSA